MWQLFSNVLFLFIVDSRVLKSIIVFIKSYLWQSLKCYENICFYLKGQNLSGVITCLLVIMNLYLRLNIIWVRYQCEQKSITKEWFNFSAIQTIIVAELDTMSSDNITFIKSVLIGFQRMCRKITIHRILFCFSSTRKRVFQRSSQTGHNSCSDSTAKLW